MTAYAFTAYFEKVVLLKRPFLTKEMCIWVVENPIRMGIQEDDRVRFWAKPHELGGRTLRVVTLSDKSTIHNAFVDRGFKP